MWDKLLTLTDLSAGIVPLMVLLFTVAAAVVIERLYFFHRVLSQGAAMERELKRAPYRGTDELRAVATKYQGALQSALVIAGVESKSTDAESMERQIDETILETVPAMDKHLWVLDTAVTLGPLMGLLGTIFGMIKTFDVLGGDGLGGGAKAVTGGIGEALILSLIHISEPTRPY